MARGAKPGERRGGRVKGQPNKRNQETIERAAASGLLPHEFLLAVSQGQLVDDYKPTFEDHMKAALGAAPYFAPKLASTEVKGDPDNPVGIAGLAVTFVKKKPDDDNGSSGVP